MSSEIRPDDTNPSTRPQSTLSITPEMFEKLYLGPQLPVHGTLRQTLGNPTPIAILGFVVALTPLSAELMGWRGAAGLNATIGANYFFGGLLLLLAGVGEFLLGNTFPSVVFVGYGAHFLTFASTWTPFYAAVSAYTVDGTQAETPVFLAGYGFYTLSMCMLSIIFLICSLRTNAVFVVVFAAAALGFGLATGAFWHLAQGGVVTGTRLLVGTGGSFFVAAVAGWYLLLAIMLGVVDMPVGLPVGDLSGLIKGGSERKKAKEGQNDE